MPSTPSAAPQKHIVSLVMNRLENDSRVIKTARTAINAGHRATLIGVGKQEGIEELEIEGVPCIRVENRVKDLQQFKLWPRADGLRDLELLIDANADAMVNVVLDLEPDILHSHDMFGLKIGARAVMELKGAGSPVKWLHDIHEFVAGIEGSYAGDYRPVVLRYERRWLREADALTTVGDSLGAELKRRYRFAAAPEIVYNAPPAGVATADGNDVRRAVGLSPETPLVVFSGVANELRGCETIQAAIGLLPNFHLAFVSEGKFVDQLVQKAEPQGFRDRVHRLPYVPTDQVAAFLSTGDIGVHGLIHYPNGEVAMPNKLFEYLHAGLPTVVSDVKAMKDFVEQHGVGNVFKAGDPESCAAALQRTYDNRAQHKQAITNDLKDRYSWQAQEQKILAIYERLLATVAPIDEDQRRTAHDWIERERAAADTRLVRALAWANAVTGKSQFDTLAARLASVKDGQRNLELLVRDVGVMGLMRRLRQKLERR